MQCHKIVAADPGDPKPFICEQARTISSPNDDDPDDVADADESSVPEEAGYGYGV